MPISHSVHFKKITFYLPGDKSLPEGWKVRSHQWWCQKRNSHRIHYEFLSPQNEFFKSRKAVVEHMTQAGLYTPEQIEMARLQSTPGSAAAAAAAAAALDKNGAGKKRSPAGDGLSALCTAAAVTSSNRLAASPSNGLADGDESGSNQLTGWKVGSSTLPVGWKLKRHEYANRTVYFYMSPTGEIFKTRRAILDYMWADGGCSEKEFSAVIVGGKQREALLREYYEAKMRGKQSVDDDDDPSDKEARSQEDIDLDELDIAEDDDEDEKNLVEVTIVKLEEANKKGAANSRRIKPEKEPVLPTRRSGRVASKIKRSRLDSMDRDGGLSDGEEEMLLAKRAGDADEDLMGNRRKTTTPRGGRQPSKEAAVDLHMVKQEDDEIKSEVAKEEEEVLERKEVIKDGARVVVEDRAEQEANSSVTVIRSSDDMMDFEDTIQYIKKEVQDAKLDEEEGGGGCAPTAAETTSEPNQTVIKTEQDRPSLVCVSSSSVERSAYNVVVNVLSDLVSTISD
jgi:hypothetical protein